MKQVKIADCRWSCRFFSLHQGKPQVLHNTLRKHTVYSCKDSLYTSRKYIDQCTSLLCYTLIFSCLCSTVLSIHCVGRCVRYTCWQTRFLCVRLSGSGCLTPPASLVWRQVRWGYISTVPSDPIPCDLSYCHSNSHWKPWLLDSFSTAQPWSHTISPFIWCTLSSLSMLYLYLIKGPNANIRALLVALR